MARMVRLIFIIFIGFFLTGCSNGGAKIPFAEPIDITTAKNKPVQITLPGNDPDNNSLTSIVTVFPKTVNCQAVHLT